MSPRIINGWMREWPEGFRREPSEPAVSSQVQHITGPTAAPAAPAQVLIGFRGRHVTFTSEDRSMVEAMRRNFQAMCAEPGSGNLGEVSIAWRDGRRCVLVNGERTASVGDAGQMLRLAVREIVRQFIHANPELIWLHAGGVAADGSAVLLAGSWGSGKSSLAVRLCQEGWTYLCDDIAPFDPGAGALIPFPQTPHVRITAEAMLPRDQLSRLAKRPIALSEETLGRAPRPLRMLVLPEFVDGATECVSVSRIDAAAALIENCLSFVKHQHAALAAACLIAEACPAYRLRYSSVPAAVALISGTGGLIARRSA